MHRRHRWAYVWGAALALMGTLVSAQTQPAWPDQTTSSFPWGAPPFEPQAHWAAPGLVRFAMTIAPGQALAQEALHLTASPGWEVLPVVWPPSEPGPVGQPVWRTSFNVWVQLKPTRPTLAPAELVVQFQGCAEDGVCHPPEHRQLALGAMPAEAPTLVVLSAPWCGLRCDRQAQRVDRLVTRGALPGWHVVKVSAPAGDASDAFLHGYGVPGVPALRWYAPGEPVGEHGGHTLLGERSEAAIRAALTSPSAP